MTIQNMFNMAKGQTLTQDGCEADVDDKRYNIGDISQKTGLQKTANGWVKPRSGKAPGAKTGEGKTPAELESAKAEVIKEMSPEMREAVMKGKTYRNVKEGRGVIDITKADLELSESKPAESKPAAKRDTDPQTYIVKKNDELRVMFQKEKDPAKKAAMKKALQKQASMMKNESFAPGEEAGSNPDPKLAKEIENGDHFERQKKEAAQKKRDEKLRQERQEGEARADDFRKKVESGEIVYNKETGKFEDGKKATEKKRLTWNPKASVSEKFNDIIKLGSKSEDRTKRPGGYIGPKVQENYIRKALSKRLGATEESIDDLLEGMDNITRKNAFNGFMENFSEDCAPRVLTKDTKIRVRKA